MRQRYLWRNGTWVEIEKVKQRAANSSGPMVMRDIEPYKSIITGEAITGRRQHRDHLKAHGCMEVGNERLGGKKQSYEAPPVRQDLEQAIRPYIDRHGVS